MAFIDPTQRPDLLFENVQENNQVEDYGFLNYEDPSNQAARREGLLTPEMESEMLRLEKRDHNISAIKEGVQVTTDVESFDFDLNLSETETFKATRHLISTTFSLPSRVLSENSANREVLLAQKTFECSKSIAKTKDEIMRGIAEARKSQVLDHVDIMSDGTATYNFNAVTDELEVSNDANKDNLFYFLDQIASNNFQEGDFELISNKGGLATAMANIAKFGGANNENQQNALNIPFPMNQSANIGINGGTDRYVAYMMKYGAIATMENIPSFYENTAPFVAEEGEITPFVTQGIMPYINKRVPTLYRRKGANTTGISPGSTNGSVDVIESWRYHYFFWTVSTYNQDLATRPNNIFKVRGSLT
jgi:hypothetical protein